MIPGGSSEKVRNDYPVASLLCEKVGSLNGVGRDAENVIDADQAILGVLWSCGINTQVLTIPPFDCQGLTHGLVVRLKRGESAALRGKGVSHRGEFAAVCGAVTICDGSVEASFIRTPRFRLQSSRLPKALDILKTQQRLIVPRQRSISWRGTIMCFRSSISNTKALG